VIPPTEVVTAPVDVASAVTAAVLALADVARLDDGSVGEIATYGRGRRVGGVRIRSDQPPRVAVHVVPRYGRPLSEIAADVRARAAAALDDLDADFADAAIDVHITDLAARWGGE